MKQTFNHALHIFRRDLRLIDNTSLNAVAEAKKISVGFIFDPRQVTKNPYKSVHALSFMCQSLTELAAAVAKEKGICNFWQGDPAAQLKKILTHHPDIDLVTVNVDYTPFSAMRDAQLAAVCKAHGVQFLAHHDALLNSPGTVLTGGGTLFKIFTPFYRSALTRDVSKPVKTFQAALASKLLVDAEGAIPASIVAQIKDLPDVFPGGRYVGLKLLKNLEIHASYAKVRDLPAQHEGTTLLSPHNKFGTLSIREVYWALREQLGHRAEPLIRSLYWRDFFTHVIADKPIVLGHAYNAQYDALVWDNDEKLFTAWQAGKTGFPLVDAGMRQLNETGFMHNRVRMVVASFLIKDLHIDWRWGEKYFAQKLVDYDPAVNNGNWQWVASTGCDSQPYFRIFNPWLQQKKFDAECVYIKRWVPELRHATVAAIHGVYKKRISGYVPPIVDHAVESKKALARYKAI